MKSTLLACCIISFSFLSGCIKKDDLEPTSYVSGETFTTFLRVDGHHFDSLVIENCVFDGATLSIGNADYVTVRNCTFKNMKWDGIKVGFIGPASNIRIENCTFENIGYNGIDSHENAPNGVITGCSFKNVALSQTGAAMAQPHHAIYWKGRNVLIEKCKFTGANQPFGNGISVRSSGIVRQNVISGFPKNGIMYYSNHPGGDTLLIENNFLFDNEYSITLGTLGDLSLHNENVIIRFNSMVQSENYSMYVSGDFETTTNIEIYGNIAVNQSQEYIRTFYDLPIYSYNLTTSEDIGFINMTNGDLHLTATSQAIGFANLAPDIPSVDIDGDLRINPINAGADE
ncbi:MAG: right-handed parallel beta-helix repeat-containing protein [Fluviicola sp.]